MLARIHLAKKLKNKQSLRRLYIQTKDQSIKPTKPNYRERH